MSSKRKFQFIFLFFVGLLVTVLFSVVSLISMARAIPWQSANQYFEAAVLEQIVTDNASLPPIGIEQHVRVQELLSDPRLVLVDFNSEQVCGSLGCAYSVYLEQDNGFQLVFQQYLNPHLPPDVELVTLGDYPSWESALPCLVIHQLVESGLQKMQVCYHSGSYRITEKTVTALAD